MTEKVKLKSITYIPKEELLRVLDKDREEIIKSLKRLEKEIETIKKRLREVGILIWSD